MAAHSGSSSSVPSLPPPCPKSPPEYPDLYGKRRELAKVQVLEREICFLEVGCYLFYFFLSTEIVTHTLVITEQSEIVGVKNGNLNSEVLQVESFLFLFHLFFTLF